ncbi:MAG: hypothetical protein J5752_06430 [Clostridiales bacterium]|nr:hypothetical protein [Clostridiales bacterium]
MVYNDVLVEQVVKHEMTSKDKLFRVLLIILAVFAGLVVNIVPLLFGIGYLFLFTGALTCGIAVFCYFSLSGLHKEYEYSLVNDSFTIDVIKAQKRRMNLFSGTVHDFEMVAKKNDDRHPYSEFDKPNVLHANCASGTAPDNEWYIATKLGTNKVLIMIEPSEKLLNAIYRQIPRNTMYRPGKAAGTKKAE